MLTRQPKNGQRGSIINIASRLLPGRFNRARVRSGEGRGGSAHQGIVQRVDIWTSKGINVNAIAPGYVATDMNAALLHDPERAASILSRIPAGRWGNPKDFKGVVVFLASRASSYVSGEVVTVDGGWMGR